MDNATGSEEKIFSAAIDVFCESGYDGARMQVIADRAGISKASLHYYFRSKELLFRKVVQNLFSKLITNITGDISPEMSIDEMLTTLITGYLHMFRKYRKQTYFIFSELMKHEGLLDEIIKAVDKLPVMEEILKRLESERQKGTIRDIRSHDIVINLIGMSVYPILAEPLIKRVFRFSEEEYEELLDRRKQVISDFTLNGIMKRE